MKPIAVSFMVLLVLVPRFTAQTACNVRVDVRWIDAPSDAINRPVHPTPGVTLTPQSAQIANDFLGARLGPIYWKESAKRYPDICLDVARADYFVFWNGVGGTTDVFVFPRRESGCVIPKVVFTTEKVNTDPEHSAKNAFKEALTFLRSTGKGDFSSVTGCIAPDKVEHLWETLRSSEGTDQPPAPPNLVSPGNDSSQSFLDISSTPAGADVELDGRFIGNTPSSVAVAVGEHAVKITKSGYKPWKRNINALAGKISVTAELESEKETTSPR